MLIQGRNRIKEHNMNTQTTIKQKYNTIIGGVPEEAEEKFSWLKNAKFNSAIIDITSDVLEWRNGIWENGVWENGVWFMGLWMCGVWKDGIFHNGSWRSGTWRNGKFGIGVWQNGLWENGIWENGVWENGVWKGGAWEAGEMWSNVRSRYVKIIQKDGALEEAE